MTHYREGDPGSLVGQQLEAPVPTPTPGREGRQRRSPAVLAEVYCRPPAFSPPSFLAPSRLGREPSV